MVIDIFSDPICPWCFIGKRRMEMALERLDRRSVTVRWRAFQLNPSMPSEGMDRASYLALKFGGADRAAQIYETIRKAGTGVGIHFAFDRITRTPNTVAAHRLIRYASREGRDGEVVEALFRAYFLDGLDIGDSGTLAGIAEGCSLERTAVESYLAGDADRQEILAEHDFAVSMDIDGVPCFIVDGRYAVVGAQEPEAFGPVFDLAAEDARQAAGP